MIAVVHPWHGPLVLVLIVLAAAGAAWVWCDLEDFWDFERREEWRRDQKAQAEWDELVRTLGPSRRR